MTIWQTIKKNPNVLVWAVVIHVFAFIAIGVSFKSSEPNISAVKQIKVIEAIAIDESKINEQLRKLKKEDKRKKRQQKKLKDKAIKTKKDIKQQQQKLQALKKKQQEQELINKNNLIKENKRLATIAKKKKEAEAALALIEKTRQEKQDKIDQEEKQRLEKIVQSKRVKYEESEVSKYKSLIRSKITQNWIFPASYQKGMKCKIVVRLIPSGDVISFRIIESSGNSAFDRSVEMAVNKASPFPVPNASTGLFDHFREVEFVFDPNA